MRVLILSKDGDGLGIAQKLATEGNKVDMYIQDKKFTSAGKGIVNKIISWRPQVAKADLVLCDMVGFGHLEQTLRRMGKTVFSCNKMADLIELDRSKGIDLLRKVGIDIPETYEYKNPKDAETLVQLWEDPGFVIKPSGNIDTSKTYVTRDPETYLWALNTLDRNQPLIVQKIVEGIEISTEGWFNGRDWITPFNHTFEEKKFLTDNLGANTGCMGNVVVRAEADRLVRETIIKLTPFVKKIGYRGPIDVNCIVNKDTAFGLEITARLGYDAIEALLEGLKEPVTDLFFETAIGVKKEMDLTNDFMIAVRASLSPWPGGEPNQEDKGQPINGLNEGNLKHIFLTDAEKKGDNYFYTASDGVVLKAAARGRTVSEARQRVYTTLGNISIMDMQYRKDIGSRVDKDMKQLKEWGWL